MASSKLVRQLWTDPRECLISGIILELMLTNLSFVNQCPIPPKSTFDYAFSTIGQSGKYVYFRYAQSTYDLMDSVSYWYHTHLSTQYCDGLRGAFIVYGGYETCVLLQRFSAHVQTPVILLPICMTWTMVCYVKCY